LIRRENNEEKFIFVLDFDGIYCFRKMKKVYGSALDAFNILKAEFIHTCNYIN